MKTTSTAKTKSAVRFVCAAAVCIALIFVVLLMSGALELVERPLLDIRYRLFNQENPVSPDIVFITVDEPSLAELNPQIGGWPWPRGTVVSRLIADYVMSGEPGAFLFDFMYSEFSPTRPGGELPTDEDWDMVESALFWPRQSYPVFFTDLITPETVIDVEQVNDVQPMFEAAEISFALSLDYNDGSIQALQYRGYLAPFDPLREYAANLHAVNYVSDPDGVVRRYPLLVEYQDRYYPSLALRAVLMIQEPDSLSIRNQTLELSKDGQLLQTVPLDERGRLRVNFHRRNTDFEFISASDVILSAQQSARGDAEPLIPSEEFRDRAVIFGAQALALMDVLDMPVETDAPGPLFHAQALSELLQGHSLHFVSERTHILSILILSLLSLALTVFIPGRQIKTLLVPVLVTAGVFGSLLLFQHAGIVVHMTAVFGSSMIGFFAGIGYVASSEGRERARITAAMGKYLAPAVMNDVLDRYEELVGEVGAARDVAVLFSDVRGFTSVSEKFPAETVVYVLNKYLEPMIDIVFQHEGTLDKMIGDAIMAFWGAPAPDPDKESAAVNAALDMITALDSINEELEEEGLPQIVIGVGINTGPVIVGNIGSGKRLDYTAIGDNVNLGSRIEGLTKYYRSPILVSQSTYEAAAENFVFVEVDTVAVKGKANGVGIFRPLCTVGDPRKEYFQEMAHAFTDARRQYLSQHFTEASSSFSSIAEKYAELDGLARMFIERVEMLIQHSPGVDWDAVWKMEEK
ncbi:CHASE2 domain-containing protein [Spirochaeta dissipatitropha]